jgi:hypothetical protein
MFFSKKESKEETRMRLMLAELKKREVEKATLLGWNEGDPYTAKEIVELHEIHCSLAKEHVFNYAPGGALWQFSHGRIADLSIAPLLRMVDDALREDSSEIVDSQDLLKRIGAHAAVAILDNNAEFFYQLHVVLSYRRDGKDLSDVPLKELRVKSGRGRKPSRIDLSRTFPLALMEATCHRLDGYSVAEKRTRLRISRQELKKGVRKWGGTVGESELSRWITKFKFGRFMAEQPIARKRRKNPD